MALAVLAAPNKTINSTKRHGLVAFSLNPCKAEPTYDDVNKASLIDKNAANVKFGHPGSGEERNNRVGGATGKLIFVKCNRCRTSFSEVEHGYFSRTSQYELLKFAFY